MAGLVERVQQDRKVRYLMVRTDQPTDGIALLGTYLAGADARGSICLYLYGADAAKRPWPFPPPGPNMTRPPNPRDATVGEVIPQVGEGERLRDHRLRPPAVY